MSEFHNKHIGPSQKEIDEMLQYLGCSSLNDLLEKIVPKNILDIDDTSIGNEVFSENDIFEGFIFYPRNLILFCAPFFIFIFNGSKYIFKNMPSEVKILFIFSPLINICPFLISSVSAGMATHLFT